MTFNLLSVHWVFMLGGIGVGLLSGAKNMKIVSIVGAALIVAGVAGLVPLASNASEVLTTRGEFATPELARMNFFSEYVFIFMIVGGAVLLSYGLVSIQRRKNTGR